MSGRPQNPQPPFTKLAWARHSHLYALGADGVLRLCFYGRWEVITTPCADDDTPYPVADFAALSTRDADDEWEESLAVLLRDGRLFERGPGWNEWKEIALPEGVG